MDPFVCCDFEGSFKGKHKVEGQGSLFEGHIHISLRKTKRTTKHLQGQTDGQHSAPAPQFRSNRDPPDNSRSKKHTQTKKIEKKGGRKINKRQTNIHLSSSSFFRGAERQAILLHRREHHLKHQTRRPVGSWFYLLVP